ncbi:hypothetical protein AbraIFM66951_006748 [Aspergillus brasiliensis]|uniref:DUF4939 domain-containing protein n=1 Tax=Aspergillus brasiliensis TaxID=319629 RepID=A0A9W6DSC8_9EURO|nr:hypothetical protein AbraCBS73388_005884 [Aspergillus brasiliensis]GKZ51689.1 hypothetical protein AbraIFM66951_006748 [Aspergillus brasiliensis]
MTSDARTNSVDGLDFKFTGKTEEFDRLLMDFRLKKVLDPNLRGDREAQCAYLATAFTGKVMTWFIAAVEHDATLLHQSGSSATYGETKKVQDAKDQAKITQIKHTTTVQASAAEFEVLAEQLC